MYGGELLLEGRPLAAHLPATEHTRRTRDALRGCFSSPELGSPVGQTEPRGLRSKRPFRSAASTREPPPRLSTRTEAPARRLRASHRGPSRRAHSGPLAQSERAPTPTPALSKRVPGPCGGGGRGARTETTPRRRDGARRLHAGLAPPLSPRQAQSSGSGRAPPRSAPGAPAGSPRRAPGRAARA